MFTTLSANKSTAVILPSLGNELAKVLVMINGRERARRTLVCALANYHIIPVVLGYYIAFIHFNAIFTRVGSRISGVNEIGFLVPL